MRTTKNDAAFAICADLISKDAFTAFRSTGVQRHVVRQVANKTVFACHHFSLWSRGCVLPSIAC